MAPARHLLLINLLLLLATAATHLPLPCAGAPSAASLPPMGWMSWLRFLCELDCETHPTACISEALYRSSADALVAGGFADAGYTGVHVDDCWASKQVIGAPCAMRP